jgi:hypothetical protein
LLHAILTNSDVNLDMQVVDFPPRVPPQDIVIIDQPIINLLFTIVDNSVNKGYSNDNRKG